jgi:N-acetylmuramoyl-L-alanine amidase
MTYDADDVQSLALCAFKEARGEGSTGMEAVMDVCVNRVGAPDFPATLHAVIYQKNAFTSMSRSDDPQFNLDPSTLTDAADIALWRVAQNLAAAVLDGSLPDITGGARYYANLATMQPDGWFAHVIVAHPETHPPTVVIGRHSFFA